MRNPVGFKFNGIDKASALWTDVENAHGQPRLLTFGYSMVEEKSSHENEVTNAVNEISAIVYKQQNSLARSHYRGDPLHRYSRHAKNSYYLRVAQWKITTDIPIRSVPISTDISLVYERDDGGVSGFIQTLVTASYSAAGVVCIVGGLATAGAAYITALVVAGISTALSVIYVGWTLYNETPGKPVTSLPRSVTNAPIVAVHSNFTPSADCNVKFQLENASPRQTWVHFGNTTSDTSFHTTHFYQSGALRGLKMKQYDVAPASKRQLTVGEWINGISPNWIQTVYWTDDSQTAFNDWNTAGTEPIAQWAGNYIWSNNAEVACLDLNDDGGTVFQGVGVTDDTDTEISLDDAAVNQYLVDCYNDDEYSTK